MYVEGLAAEYAYETALRNMSIELESKSNMPLKQLEELNKIHKNRLVSIKYLTDQDDRHLQSNLIKYDQMCYDIYGYKHDNKQQTNPK